MMVNLKTVTVWKVSEYRVFFWSVFSRIRTEYGNLISILCLNKGKSGPEKTPYLDTGQGKKHLEFYMRNLARN